MVLARVFGGWAWLALVAAVVPACASAQAWLPPKGTASVSVGYSDVLNLKHYLPDGSEFDAGHSRIRTLALQIAYSPTDRLMLMAGIPYVQTRYTGSRPHPTEVDDGHEHATFTDLHLSANYQLLEWPLALAPYVAAVIPSHDYETLGHAAPGRGLNEIWLGFGIGKSLDAWLPRTYVQGQYNYAFVEKVAGVSHDRSNFDLEIGYFVTPRWSVRALGYWQVTHGGVDVPMPPSNPLYPHHDQLAAEGFFNVGAGAAWLVNERVSAYATYLTSVRGKNGHKLDQDLSLGFSVGWGPQP